MKTKEDWISFSSGAAKFQIGKMQSKERIEEFAMLMAGSASGLVGTEPALSCRWDDWMCELGR